MSIKIQIGEFVHELREYGSGGANCATCVLKAQEGKPGATVAYDSDGASVSGWLGSEKIKGSGYYTREGDWFVPKEVRPPFKFTRMAKETMDA